jgi:hypothetical protein
MLVHNADEDVDMDVYADVALDADLWMWMDRFMDVDVDRQRELWSSCVWVQGTRHRREGTCWPPCLTAV